MKNLKHLTSLKTYSLWIVSFLIIVTIQSCNNDDDMAPAANEQADMQDSPNPNPPSDGGDSQSGSENAEGAQGDITLYTVSSDGDDIVKKTDFKVSGKDLELQKDIEKHQQVWNLVKKLVPKNYRAKMSEFMIFAGEENNTAGYVFNTKQDLSKWQMGIAVDFAFFGGIFDAEGELSYTIIHEFGHILTLDDQQVDASISESACKNYLLSEGCAKEQAYINKLYQSYWADIVEEFNMVNSESEGQAFYEKYEDRFVTPYASTNPGEDIAEVFTNFILNNSRPTGTKIKDKKLNLMYDEAALISIRDFVRNQQSSARGRSFLPDASVWKRSKKVGGLSSCLTHKKGH